MEASICGQKLAAIADFNSAMVSGEVTATRSLAACSASADGCSAGACAPVPATVPSSTAATISTTPIIRIASPDSAARHGFIAKCREVLLIPDPRQKSYCALAGE